MRQITVAANHHVQEQDNLTDLVWQAAQQRAHHPMFLRREGQHWQPVSAQQFVEQVRGLAQGLIAAGISPGDRVALMAKTRYEWPLFDFALWSIGAITVPIYETCSADQVSWILGDSQAVGIVVETDAHRQTVSAVQPELPHLRHVWHIEQGCVAQLNSSGAHVDPDQVDSRRHQLRADQVATLIYTSGTTGRPKGCQLTHRNLLAVTMTVVAHVREVFTPAQASTVMFLPLAHVLARAVQLMCLAGGITIAHASNIKDLSRDLAAVKPTFLLAVPRVFEKLHERIQSQAGTGVKGRLFAAARSTAIAYSQASQPSGRVPLLLRARHAAFTPVIYRTIRRKLGGRLGICVSGGAALDPTLQHFFRGIGVHILQGYGLTETSSATNVNVVATNRIGTVGRPLPGLSVAVDGDGQIRVKGDTVFTGYYNNPAATAGEFDSQGYFLTGDLGTIDDAGFLTIVGRAKEILVTAGGKNVAPGPLEDCLRQHPLISQAMVVGDDRPYVAALLTVDPEALPHWLERNGLPCDTAMADLVENPNLLSELQHAVNRANAAVSQAEAIKRFVVLPTDFTEANGLLTPSLKIRRAAIAHHFAEQIDTLYTRPRE